MPQPAPLAMQLFLLPSQHPPLRHEPPLATQQSWLVPPQGTHAPIWQVVTLLQS